MLNLCRQQWPERPKSHTYAYLALQLLGCAFTPLDLGALEHVGELFLANPQSQSTQPQCHKPRPTRCSDTFQSLLSNLKTGRLRFSPRDSLQK